MNAAGAVRPAGLSPGTAGALVLLLLSLGLPWGVVGEEERHIPGWVAPVSCVAEADGGLWCPAGFVQPGYTVAGQGAAFTGYATSARVFLVAAVALLAWAALRRIPPRLDWAIGLIAVAVILTGTALRLGALAALLALALLVLERRGGLLPARLRAAGPAHGS